MKSFLTSPDITLKILEDKEAQFRTLEEQATKTTTVLSGMPSGGDKDRNALLASLSDARAEYYKWLHLWHNSCNEVRNFLTSLAIDSAPRRCILQQRYIHKKKWSEILPIVHEVQKQWRQEPMSERQMYVEHLKALEDAAAWINTTGKYMYIGRV